VHSRRAVHRLVSPDLFALEIAGEDLLGDVGGQGGEQRDDIVLVAARDRRAPLGAPLGFEPRGDRALVVEVRRVDHGAGRREVMPDARLDVQLVEVLRRPDVDEHDVVLLGRNRLAERLQRRQVLVVLRAREIRVYEGSAALERGVQRRRERVGVAEDAEVLDIEQAWLSVGAVAAEIQGALPKPPEPSDVVAHGVARMRNTAATRIRKSAATRTHSPRRT
jgi:hypothetical protein